VHSRQQRLAIPNLTTSDAVGYSDVLCPKDGQPDLSRIRELVTNPARTTKLLTRVFVSPTVNCMNKLTVLSLSTACLAAGWAGHALLGDRSGELQPSQSNVSGPPQVRCEDPVRILERPPSVEDDCQAELLALRDELERAKFGLASCGETGTSWPTDIDAIWQLDGFRERVMESAEELGFHGEVTFHCDEFPCIAQFSGDIDKEILTQSLQRIYGSGVHVAVKTHTTVGPWGSKKIRLATAIPEELADEEIRDRFDDRSWELLIQAQQAYKDEMRESDEQK
jgi:hypothetical protein